MPHKGPRPKCAGCGKGMIQAHSYNTSRSGRFGQMFVRGKVDGVYSQIFTCIDGKPHRYAKK